MGIITANKHPNPITRTGEKIGSLWLLLTLLLSAFSIGGEITWVILFAYLAYVAYVGVTLFSFEIVPGFAIIEKIPDATSIYTTIRAIFPYL